MRKIILLIILSISSPIFGDEGKVIRFGVVPQFEARKLASIWTPILQELSKRLGYQFKMEGAARIPDFENAFIRGDFDFAYMNPYHGLIATEEQKYFPILRDGSRKLYGILVVTKDSTIKDVKDLDKKRIAFPAPNALGASLLMRSILKNEYKIDFTPVYSQTHTSSYLNVILGEADAAGGVYATLQEQKDSIKNGVRILLETPKLTPHPIMAHPSVDRKIVKLFKDEFIKMSQEEKFKKFFAQIPMEKPESARSDDYQELKKYDLKRFYVK